MEGEEEEDEIDLEDMTEEELKDLIEDVIEDMVRAGELEAGEEFEADEDEGEEEEMRFLTIKEYAQNIKVLQDTIDALIVSSLEV